MDKLTLDQMRLALNESGMYSPLDKLALETQRGKGTPAEYLAELSKKPGFRRQEVEDRNIPTPDQKMTKEQFLGHLNEHPAPKVEVVTLGEGGKKLKYAEWAEKNYPDMCSRLVAAQRAGDSQTFYELNSFLSREWHAGMDRRKYESRPKYSQYQLPGGENYREVLLKLPENRDTAARKQRLARDTAARKQRLAEIADEMGDAKTTHARYAELHAERARLANEHLADNGPYQSRHWAGHKNVLAHIRHNDRTDADGKKVLFIEELQSDWGQKGRENGFTIDATTPSGFDDSPVPAGPFVSARKFGVYKDGSPLVTKNKEGKDVKHIYDTAEAAQEAAGKHGGDMRDMGMQANTEGWVKLGLKHIIDKAVKEGYDRVAFINGDQSAERYDLSKHVDTVIAHGDGDGKYMLDVVLKDGRTQSHYGLTADGVADHVGKDVAEKLVNAVEAHRQHNAAMRKAIKADNVAEQDSLDAERQKLPANTLSGLDLKVGGEGMKAFYDKILPKVAMEVVRKLGGNGMTTAEINTSDGPYAAQFENHPPGSSESNAGPFRTRDEARRNLVNPTDETREIGATRQPGFDITDKMRKHVMSQGQPLYARGGKVIGRQSGNYPSINKADGGVVQGGSMPTLAQMRMALAKPSNMVDLQNIGANEAPDLNPKIYFPPTKGGGLVPAPGGVNMPIGGIDMSRIQPGQQLMPQNAMQPQGGAPQGAPQAPGGGPGAPGGGQSNILQMTPQGQTMAALSPSLGQSSQEPQGMARGGAAKSKPAKSVEQMRQELAKKNDQKETRVTIHAEGPGGVKGIVVPRHTLEGNVNSGAVGLHKMNVARAKVYGAEHRPPLTLNKIAVEHKKTLDDHFAKSIEDQLAAEEEALGRLRAAKHLSADANTLDESEKLDTVRHERDEEGRSHIGFASKGVAGHALYTSGHGKNTKYHVINTCPGQTEGCGGGKDANGIVDTKKGTCFAPNAESQYPAAATRRAAHEQAKHDPAMTNDWILAHTGSLREAARLADRNNQRLLFRPNVVDETDVSSRHVIRHLNKQRKSEEKPPIISNSYGKTNELHDPENGYYVTHSNVGPKVKNGQEISENIKRDKARVRNTILAADNNGDFVNEQGHKTPPKGSYMVTDVKRGSPMSKRMQEHITHAKYWSAGRLANELTEEERAQGEEGNFGGNHKPTTESKAHYGHRTVQGERFDYQRQHILHPRLVNVPERKKNKKTGQMETVDHMIPTDSRFKDTEFLPKHRFKTKNGKEAGHILMTTPTESTSNVGHHTSFTHHVGEGDITHAINNNGEYEIDRPEDQIRARGKKYVAPEVIKFYADGGGVGGRPAGLSHDDFHAFPEQNGMAQRHLAMRLGDDEDSTRSSMKRHVSVMKDLDTMRYEMSRKV